MTEVRLRDVDPGVVEAIRSLAKRNRRSLEAEIKEALTHLAHARKDALLDRIDSERAAQPLSSDSTPSIRADREERW